MAINLFDPEEEQPSYGLLKKARARISAGDTLTNNVVPGRTMLPNSIQALRGRAADLYQQGNEMFSADPDTSSLQDFARQRGQQGNAAMLNALAAQFAGESFQPVQEQLLKKAQIATEPMKMGNGIITAEGNYIKDPFAAQDKKAEFLLQQARMYETLATTAENKQQEAAYKAERDREMMAYRQLMAGIAQQNATTARMTAGNNQNKAPAGYQWATGADGSPTLAFIPGGPADPKSKVNAMPSEDERKAAGYALRIQQGLDTISGVTKETPSAVSQGPVQYGVSKVPLVGNMASNIITPEARQRVEAAQLDMLDAALTLNTGAAYTKEQLQGLTKSYFPQIGDSDKTVADKKRRLDDLIQTARIRAGRALPASAGGASAADDNDPLGYRARFGGR